ncbi:pentapeptide repeat-containing protein [Rhodovulum sulfidophilum]|uniref:Pentapeptide repeat-containing protein n=3 Tax=Rhodovulum sulfidophilum TaxID=35806 RepID=A0ABS1RUF1_RHOSU|nr:pentapeptide repeat-containing protein [Rhodovulum sulfidophilum]MBL3596585.1 pentapeptide repeat-containing protein [Rhodovulum sulfidophilum]MBL3609722.1 pentapeptide repeat-containing protein [Rhodovulum sulfidophilum]
MNDHDAENADEEFHENGSRPLGRAPDISIYRIDALTKNARNTWLVLLGILAFTGITLMGVEHIDFYGIDRATKLPLFNVEVAPRYFFVAAPILTAAFYIHFHLHLIRLWDALEAAENRIGDRPLGDAVMPWLVTDAVLHLRNRWRSDNCATPRVLDRPAAALNLALTWGFGLIVLGLLWWLSMPARTFWMTAIACAAFLAAAGAGLSSLESLFDRMNPGHRAWQTWPSTPVVLIVIASLAFSSSYLRTAGPPGQLAPIDMTGLALVEKPPGWLPRDIALRESRANWCKREGMRCGRDGLSQDQRDAFEGEFRLRREAALSELRKPQWHQPGNHKPDFRAAQLSGTFLAGADLGWAQLSGANLRGAQLEGADLSGAQLDGAELMRAQLEGANLSGARLTGAFLTGAQLQGAQLREAQLERADLIGAQLTGAKLREARMDNAKLSAAQMKGATLVEARMNDAILVEARLEKANLFGAQLERADLSWAQLAEADLRNARLNGADLRSAQLKRVKLLQVQMERANLSRSFLTGAPTESLLLQLTNLAAAENNGGAVRFADLRGAVFDEETDFRNAFMDGSVQVSDGFRQQMADPCQWHADTLSDEEFFGRWRGWIEATGGASSDWPLVAPSGWLEVRAIPPPEGCVWKTGSMATGAGAKD